MKFANTESKKILFAHSAGSQGGVGKGSFGLVSYLKEHLPSEITVNYPIIDNPEAPTYEKWKRTLDDEFKFKTKPVILVGHSLGGSILLKYLSEEKLKNKVWGLFLIATPFWGQEDWKIADYILSEDFESELSGIQHIYLYHSDEDPIVPFEHLNRYKKALPHATVRIIHGKDHAFEEGLPELVDDIKSILS